MKFIQRIRGRRSGGYRGSRGEWRSEESGIEGGVKIASHISELVGALSQTGRGETTKRLGMSEIMSSEKISEFGLYEAIGGSEKISELWSGRSRIDKEKFSDG